MKFISAWTMFDGLEPGLSFLKSLDPNPVEGFTDHILPSCHESTRALFRDGATSAAGLGTPGFKGAATALLEAGLVLVSLAQGAGTLRLG